MVIDVQPFIPEASRDLKILDKPIQLLIRDILTLLTFYRGKKIYDRNFGSSIYEFVFDQLDSVSTAKLESELTECLQQSTVFQLLLLSIKKIENGSIYLEIQVKLYNTQDVYSISAILKENYIELTQVVKILESM